MPRRGVVAVAAMVLVGCAGIPLGFEAPRVNLSDLHFVSGTLFEQRLALALRITNPNQRSIEIEGVRFTVDVNGRQFARGLSDTAFTLRPLGDTVVEVPVVTSLHEILAQIGRRHDPRGFEYRISGKLLLGGFGSLPFVREGRVVLPEQERDRL